MLYAQQAIEKLERIEKHLMYVERWLWGKRFDLGYWPTEVFNALMTVRYLKHTIKYEELESRDHWI